MSSTKNEGITVLDKVEQDEPVFVLRARDMMAPEIVREWAYRSRLNGTPREKADEARRIADAMEDWQITHSRKVAD